MEFKSAVERSKENPRQRIVIVLPPQTVRIQRKVLKKSSRKVHLQEMPEQGLLDQEFLLHLDYLLNAENPNFFQELR